jgi:hypothetical protein
MHLLSFSLVNGSFVTGMSGMTLVVGEENKLLCLHHLFQKLGVWGRSPPHPKVVPLLTACLSTAASIDGGSPNTTITAWS